MQIILTFKEDCPEIGHFTTRTAANEQQAKSGVFLIPKQELFEI